MFKIFKTDSISCKLICSFLGMGITPLLILTIIASVLSIRTEEQNAKSLLESIKTQKKPK